MNVFTDTNVLMDLLLVRRPFVTESRKVWFLAERGKVRGLVSALSFPSIYYIIYITRKLGGIDAALSMMTTLRDAFPPVLLAAMVEAATYRHCIETTVGWDASTASCMPRRCPAAELRRSCGCIWRPAASSCRTPTAPRPSARTASASRLGPLLVPGLQQPPQFGD
jgi:hypothetical protein